MVEAEMVHELQRPSLSLDRDSDPVTSFIEEMQNAIDTGDATRFNRYFAQDVLWGSPFGAVAVGYDQIHAIHLRMFASVVPVKGAARYDVEHVRFPAEDIAIAYVRRLSKHSSEPPAPSLPGTFDELALLVLVRRDGKWWLAAAQHVPDRRDVYAKQ
jgi:uncharacterized protein (TIGR02246 family)